MFYAERSGGIRTYLDEKVRFARQTNLFEHHLVVPGKRERHDGGRHELRSLTLAASNGYRIPLGAGAVMETLRAIRPRVVILHDPFWRPLKVTREAHRWVLLWSPSTMRRQRSTPPGSRDRTPSICLRFDVCITTPTSMWTRSCRPSIPTPIRDGPPRSSSVSVSIRRSGVGRVALEKRITDVLAAMSRRRWGRPLLLVGDGPARGVVEARARSLGLSGLVRFRPFVSDRRALVRIYRKAACVVAPGPHETFGLAVLEAAASGARVVTCSSTPAAHVAVPLVDTFR
ncbi:MAG TPA: glycosyltransferase, partial [Solirubrobacteraceae bacterium]|nr:glycosyltransferase [Solirubrobacteraceae bacterium]